MSNIDTLTAREILDTQGRPTLEATCYLSSGVSGTAAISSSDSTGTIAALELRDGDPNRYDGAGCKQSVNLIEGELSRVLGGREFTSQTELDQMMIILDGTPNKARLGANTLLAVSLAFAKASATEKKQGLHQYLDGLMDLAPQATPMPTINVFQGTNTASLRNIDLVVPSAENAAQTFGVMKRVKLPNLAKINPHSEAVLSALSTALEEIDLESGEELGLIVDVGTNRFANRNRYTFEGKVFNGEEMLEKFLNWFRDYPIVGLIDPFGEDDWKHWRQLSQEAPAGALIVGGDFLSTTPLRVHRAAEHKVVNGIQLKLNQVGTLTEALEAHQQAQTSGWKVLSSVCRGETDDPWLADVAVGWGTEFIQLGSAQSSVAKRLLEIV